MTGQEMIGLIEELVEIKVRHHAAISAKGPYNGNRDLARAVAMMNVADRDRLQQIRTMLVRGLDGADQVAEPTARR